MGRAPVKGYFHGTLFKTMLNEGMVVRSCNTSSTQSACHRCAAGAEGGFSILTPTESIIKWGFPKIRGTFVGVHILRTVVDLGLYWGPPILGNDQVGSQAPNAPGTFTT